MQIYDQLKIFTKNEGKMYSVKFWKIDFHKKKVIILGDYVRIAKVLKWIFTFKRIDDFLSYL